MHEQPDQHLTECADYIEQLAFQLARIARAKDLIQVATLLEMAAIEAKTAAENLQAGNRSQSSGRRPHVSRDRPNHVHGI
jgi:hypothetical protein